MDTHLRLAYCILNLLLDYGTGFKQQLTFLQYPRLIKASCEVVNLIIFKRKSFCYVLSKF